MIAAACWLTASGSLRKLQQQMGNEMASRNENFKVFESMCDVCGQDATEEQIYRLADYVRENFGTADFSNCAEIALRSNAPSGIYTELSMMLGECGA